MQVRGSKNVDRYGPEMEQKHVAGLHERSLSLNLPGKMRGFLATTLVLGALGSATAAHASALTVDESVRLARSETIIREQTFESGNHRYVGGITYTVMDATPLEVAAIIDNVDALRRVLPRTKRARI